MRTKPKARRSPEAATKRNPTDSPLAARLAKLGIRRGFDFVLHLPLRYEDETRITPISGVAREAPVQVEGEVIETKIVYRPRRQLACRITDGEGELWLRFFNFYPSVQKALAPGARVRAFGEVRSGFFGGEMVHPRFRVVRPGTPLPEALTPVYPTTAGLSQAALRRLIDQALEREQLGDTLPAAVTRSAGVGEFAAAVMELHRPRPDSDGASLASRSHPAWRRIKFDELLAQQISMRMHYRDRKSKSAPALSGTGRLASALLERLPFRLTRAQVRAWGEIGADLAQPHPMHRLLQGDVGSGKTIVAALACLRAVENGVQAAVMAPTEILAEQHYRKFSDWLDPLGVRQAWITGGQTKKDRERAIEAVSSGETQIAIGTHALIQEQVGFADLGLAVVDEQHRFGVEQRLALRMKGRAARREPHLLMMSATPIPRTLSMSYYADLDISVIDELPPGRKAVATRLVADSRRDEVIRRIRDACRAGHQAYWVCPLIESSAEEGPGAGAERKRGNAAVAGELRAVLETHAQLMREFPEWKIGLVHGRLPQEEKAQVMADFAAGRVQLLVATTVIEVGVDVPNASLMVIEHAERFGLAQLHQLRGRIGRRAQESVCVLLYQSPLGEAARARLKVVFESSDGFEIARQDLLQRGPGEYLGSRQSGVPLLRFADLDQDQDLLAAARGEAERMLRDYPEAARAHLDRWLGGRGDLMKA